MGVEAESWCRGGGLVEELPGGDGGDEGVSAGRYAGLQSVPVVCFSGFMGDQQ